jgi:SAM-dependent methyltransferase
MRRDWDARARENPRAYINWPDVPNEEDAFFASGRADYATYVTPFLQKMNFDPRGKHALEIGCGIGRLARRFVEEFAQYTGVDVSPAMIAQAQALQLPRARFRAVSGGGLDGIPDASVDFVFSFAVFQHVPARAAIANYFREAARVLRPGGLFRLHMKGLWTAQAGALLFEAGYSLNPRFVQRGWRRAPFLRLRHLDTWQGISFPLPEARRLCAELRLEILEVQDPWTIMQWIGGRKRPQD